MKKILITGGSGFIASEITRYLKNKYIIFSPNRATLNLLDKKSIFNFFNKNDTIYDLVIHTAIMGGSRLQNDDYEVFYNNVKMFINLIEYKDRFKKLINFSSGASLDREQDINGTQKVTECNPNDFYGFSKNIIDRLINSIDNFYTLRIFNVFSENEKESRFLKICKNNVLNKKNIHISNDRYFDFFASSDMIKVIEYYLFNNDMVNDIDLCYKEKYKLSDIAKIINKNNTVDIIIDSVSKLNYIGNHQNLYSLGFNFTDPEKIFQHY